MATPATSGQFWGVLKDHLKVKTHGDWRDHNRGSRGTGWGPVHGVMMHHFGPYSSTAGAVDYARRGSSGLPGPLYPVVVDRSGVVHLVGWGRCNHAGSGDGDVLRHVIREDYPLPRPNETDVDGNSRFYGICLLNKGDGKQSYPKAQLRAGAAVAAILIRHHRGWTEQSVIGHKEWQPGKPDPNTSMKNFRELVETYRRDLPDLRGKAPDPAKDCGCNCQCGHD